MTTKVSDKQIVAMAIRDARDAYNESGSTQTPDGGWDSWLVNGLGIDATCQLFGEDPAENQGGWSDSMSQKLQSYNDAACHEMCHIEVENE